jgi:hypothetical protein
MTLEKHCSVLRFSTNDSSQEAVTQPMAMTTTRMAEKEVGNR